MLYQSLKLTNGIWILAELRIQPGNPNYTVSYPQPFSPDVDKHILLENIFSGPGMKTVVFSLYNNNQGQLSLMEGIVAHCLHVCLSPSPQLSLKCRAPEVSQYVYQMYDSVLKN